MATPELAEFDEVTEADELRRLLRKREGELRRAKAKTEDLVQAIREGAREAAVALGNPPPVKLPKRDQRPGKAEAGILHLSDWQIGKRTDSYSSDVALDRVGRLSDKVAQITAIERADHPVRELHVLLGGDFVEGNSIFPGQQFELDASLVRQTLTAKRALEELLREQLSVYERVTCWEVEGNHGRSGRKGENRRDDNSDLLVYELVRDALEGASGVGKRLTWHPRERWYRVFEVGAYRALLVHGDQVKQFGGNTPAFGIARKVNGWASGVLEPFTDVYMGHFHQPLVIPLANGRGRTFLNPSIESDSAYAKEFMAATGTPGQRLNFVEPAAGRVTTDRVLWLD